MDLDAAFEMLALMKKEGYTPNAMTYNALILDAGHIGDLGRATKALDEMEVYGCWC